MTSDPTIEAFGESLQYRERYQEGYNTVPLSPWGYWPQMSKMENLLDFPAFQVSGNKLCSLFARWNSPKRLSCKGSQCSVKNRKTSGLFGRQKGFLLFEVYHHMKILSNSVKK